MNCIWNWHQDTQQKHEH